MNNWESKQSDFTKIILAGDEEAAVTLARTALEEGATPVEFFENCISPALQDIGKRFETLDIIGMSALLTTCLPYMKDVCDFLEGKGIREKYPVLIGGAATHPEIAEEMGANTHGSSAAEGVEKCKMLLGKLKSHFVSCEEIILT